MFHKISVSQDSTCLWSLLNKCGGFQDNCFLNFAKFLRIPFLQKTPGSSNKSLVCLPNTAFVWGDLRLPQYRRYLYQYIYINLTFYSYIKSRTRVLNVGLEKIDLIYKVVTSSVCCIYTFVSQKKHLQSILPTMIFSTDNSYMKS